MPTPSFAALIVGAIIAILLGIVLAQMVLSPSFGEAARGSEAPIQREPRGATLVKIATTVTSFGSYYLSMLLLGLTWGAMVISVVIGLIAALAVGLGLDYWLAGRHMVDEPAPTTSEVNDDDLEVTSEEDRLEP